MKEVILKSLRNNEKKFNGNRAVVIKEFGGGRLYVRCLGVGLEVKKQQYKEVE